MSWLRMLFFANWRNRGVALFFAFIIWFVAFQSEKQSWTDEVEVHFSPQDPGRYVITSITQHDAQSGDVAEEPFSGRVRIILEGPRKQIEEWKNRYSVNPAFFRLDVSPETELHAFDQEDFDFPRNGVTMTKITPETVRIEQDEWDTKIFQDLGGQLEVNDRRPGYQVKSKQVKPNEIAIKGPKSILDSVEIGLSVNMGLFRDEYEGEQALELRFKDPTIPLSAREKVRLAQSTVAVTVILEPRTEVLTAEEIKVTFRISPGDPILVKFPEERIPVQFEGPQDQIERLRDQLQDDPRSTSLSVLVPPASQANQLERDLTFTEEELDLYDFPGVQVRPHPSRSRENRGPFTYTVLRPASTEE